MKHLLFRILVIILSCVWTFSLSAQLDYGIGQWKSHLPYQAGKRLTQSPEQIIYATDWSLLLIDKDELSYDYFSKVDGLSDIGISEVAYDKYNDQLIIAYTNSNIDIVKDGEVINLPNIKTNTIISGDKSVYHIDIIDDHTAFFSTGFGIVELNTKDYFFGTTTFTGVKVNQMALYGDELYMAADDGIYRIEYNQQLNLSDFGAWKSLDDDPNLPAGYACTSMVIHKDKFYAVVDDEIYGRGLSTDFGFVFQYEDSNFGIEFLASGNDDLLIGLKDRQFSSHLAALADDGTMRFDGALCSDRILDALQDEQGRIWFADEWNEIRYSANIESNCQRLTFPSPYSHRCSDINFKDGLAYFASGGVSDAFGYLSNRDGFYIKDGNKWNNIHQGVLPAIEQADLVNFFQILPHPDDERLFLGTYWAGLATYTPSDQSIQVYNKTNSTLRGAIGDETRERISGLAFDKAANLWVSNFGTNKPLSVMTPDGQWYSFSVKSGNTLTEIAIDDFGYKWIVVFGNSGGVLVYDEGEDLISTSDDRQIFLNQGNSELTTNTVNTIEVDLDGRIWVGTGEGPVIFECGNDVFDGDCGGRRIKVLQDSIAAFLLADVEIKTIEVDGANRKWFGSNRGIFVQSAVGDQEELRFTTDNSPLFDDNILQMGYDENTGEMYISTDKGIQSYRTSTSVGSKRHIQNNVYAFPNPVRPDYRGPIAIKGLARDANVKITDINGRLVHESQALGGQAIWDGNDFTGRRADTGVYLVFSSASVSFEEADTFVTKILFVH